MCLTELPSFCRLPIICIAALFYCNNILSRFDFDIHIEPQLLTPEAKWELIKAKFDVFKVSKLHIFDNYCLRAHKPEGILLIICSTCLSQLKFPITVMKNSISYLNKFDLKQLRFWCWKLLNHRSNSKETVFYIFQLLNLRCLWSPILLNSAFSSSYSYRCRHGKSWWKSMVISIIFF